MSHAVRTVYSENANVPTEQDVKEASALVFFLHQNGWVLVPQDSKPAHEGAIQRALGI